MAWEVPSSYGQNRQKPIGKIVAQHQRPNLVYEKTEELANVYANGGIMGSARGGRIFIDGDKIYSYSKNWVIAERIAPNTYKLNINKYSQTTSKQTNEVRRALEKKGAKIIESNM